MDRKYKFKGTPYQKPLTREENIREMESERSEFMYDPKIGKIRLRKELMNIKETILVVNYKLL